MFRWFDTWRPRVWHRRFGVSRDRDTFEILDLSSSLYKIQDDFFPPPYQFYLGQERMVRWGCVPPCPTRWTSGAPATESSTWAWKMVAHVVMRFIRTLIKVRIHFLWDQLAVWRNKAMRARAVDDKNIYDHEQGTGSRGQFSGIISRLPVGSCSWWLKLTHLLWIFKRNKGSPTFGSSNRGRGRCECQGSPRGRWRRSTRPPPEDKELAPDLFLAGFIGRHLQNPPGESCIVLVVVATKQVAHAKVVDDVRGGSSCVLQYGFKTSGCWSVAILRTFWKGSDFRLWRHVVESFTINRKWQKDHIHRDSTKQCLGASILNTYIYLFNNDSLSTFITNSGKHSRSQTWHSKKPIFFWWFV